MHTSTPSSARPSVRVLAALAALTAFTLGACGSSGSDADGTTTTEAATEESTPTSEGGDGEPGTLTEEQFTVALQTGLSSGSVEDGELVVADGEAECVAPVWIEVLGVDALNEAQVSEEDLSDPSLDVSSFDLDLSTDDAQALIDAFEPCGVDLFGLLGQSLTVGLDEQQQACAMEDIDPELANALLLTAFSSDDGDGTAEFDALIAQLTETCELPAN